MSISDLIERLQLLPKVLFKWIDITVVNTFWYSLVLVIVLDEWLFVVLGWIKKLIPVETVLRNVFIELKVNVEVEIYFIIGVVVHLLVINYVVVKCLFVIRSERKWYNI